MRVIGVLLVLTGLSSGAFSIALGRYLEAGHSGSTLRNLGNRIAVAVPEDPELIGAVKAMLAQVAGAFSWLNAAFVVTVGAALVLVGVGLYLVRVGPQLASTSGRT